MKRKHSTHSLLNRAICFLLAVYLFNFSIDSRDLQPNHVAEDLSVNDIESYFEFVAEAVMGFENAIQEHDEHDQESGGAFEFKKMYYALPNTRFEFQASQEQLDFHATTYSATLRLGFPAKIPHPPKAI